MKKLVCSITQDWNYCTDEQWEKIQARLKDGEEYISKRGKELLEKHDGDVEAARAEAAEQTPRGKIRCTVTGELLVISDKRLAHLCEKNEMTEEELRQAYVSRVAKRLRKELAESEFSKKWDKLDEAEQADVDEIIRQMSARGELPAPAAPKGSKQKEPSTKKATKKKPEMGSVEVQSAKNEPTIDIYRKIPGESAKDRRNRIRREKRALSKMDA